jgi:CelD/BcsL family acetyltransferase involved in cellulose biosynthesis
MQQKNLSGASLKRNFWKFHNLVAREFAKQGWLFMGVLKAGNSIAACQYAFQYNNKVSFYQSGIDPEYEKYSIGLLSTAYMIKESINRGFGEYDFLRGAELYKSSWTKTYRHNTEIIVWNTAMKTTLAFVAFHSRRFLGKIKRRINTKNP